MSILLCRVYYHGAEPKGIKVFVDRLWPRGISKAAAPWSVWLKDIAPSDNLRKWFAHDEATWTGFKQRYFTELDIATDKEIESGLQKIISKLVKSERQKMFK